MRKPYPYQSQVSDFAYEKFAKKLQDSGCAFEKTEIGFIPRNIVLVLKSKF